MGGARGGGLADPAPRLSGLICDRTADAPGPLGRLEMSVYGVEVASKARRMNSPRPGRVGQ